MRTNDIHMWLIERLREEETVSRAAMEDALENDAEHALLFLEFLVSRGVLRSQREGDRIVYTVTDDRGLDSIARSYGGLATEGTTTRTAPTTEGLPGSSQLVVSVRWTCNRSFVLSRTSTRPSRYANSGMQLHAC